MLDTLPSELLFSVIANISCQDLSSLRLTCKFMHTFCDQPRNWKTIDLKPSTQQELWKLAELKDTIEPHASHIQSIRIWGVRDNTVQYLLNQCLNLQHLKICSWNTLSDHCLRLLPSQSLKIKTLELMGSSQQNNFVSVDAYTLGNLLIHSPEMTNLVFCCEIHLHAETFITELERKKPINDLQMFVLGGRKTWLREHVLELIDIYPGIKMIYLLPKAILYHDDSIQDNEIDTLLNEKLKQAMKIMPPPREIPLLSNQEFIIYDKRITTTCA